MSGKSNAGPRVVNASNKITAYAGKGSNASFIEIPTHRMMLKGIKIAAHLPFSRAGSGFKTSNLRTPIKSQVSAGSWSDNL